MRILILDDEAVSLTRMTKLLSHWGVCDTAINGNQAVTLFRKAFNDGSPYDIVTIDIEIPDGNGLDVLKELHDMEDELGMDGWHSKKLVITAQSNLKNLQKAAQCNCDAFLVKPVKMKVLEEKMIQIWR